MTGKAESTGLSVGTRAPDFTGGEVTDDDALRGTRTAGSGDRPGRRPRHPYRYVDLDLDPRAQRQLRWMVGGEFRNPVVQVGGEWLEQPTIRELQWALARHGLL